MKIPLFKVLLAVGLLSHCSGTVGEEFEPPVSSLYVVTSYKCSIRSALHMSDEGLMTPNDFRNRVGKEFVVDTGNGRMNGAVTNYDSESQREILQHQSPFSAFTLYGLGDTHLDYLYIEEFNRNKAKPFMFVESGSNTVYSGLCEPFGKGFR